MLRLLRGLWQGITAARHATMNILFLLVIVVVLVALFSSDRVQVPERTALVINPGGAIVEQKRPTDPFERLLTGNQGGEQESLLRDIQDAISHAAGDDRVTMMVLDLSRVGAAPMSMLEEIGQAITTFKATGKRVYAFGPGYSQTQYFIAAHADQVLVDRDSFPTFGSVFLTGFGIYPTYFKSALDRFKLRFHIFRVGEYKSAVEPYIRDDMSEESAAANLEWIGELWSVYGATIGRQRLMSEATFDGYANRYDELLALAGNDPTELAIREGFIDGAMSRQQFRDMMIAEVGEQEDTFSQIDYASYLAVTRPPIPIGNPAADKIAVIVASGTILDGDQPAGTIGSENLTELIRIAREDETVKAVVLRIDSPGGSVSASERIRTELLQAQTEGKPVVASMSGYAASGGYWVSADANRIFAQATTVTGSIGTFLVFPTFDEALGEFGINTDGVGTTALSGGLDPFRPLNPMMARILNQSVTQVYDRFLRIVAEGRDMTPEAVDEIARGHVWTGQRALELGLIDAIGSLDDAIKAAAQLADVTDYEVLYLERELSAREQLLNEIMNVSALLVERLGGDATALSSQLFKLPEDIKSLVRMSQNPGVYLQCHVCKALIPGS